MTEKEISNKIYEYHQKMFTDKCVNKNNFSEADATIDILVLIAKNKKYKIYFESIHKNDECVVNESEPFYLQKLLQLIETELLLYKLNLLELE